MTVQLVLASASPFRRMLLSNAGIAFDWQAADIDERGIEEPLAAAGAAPAEVATILANAKAGAIAELFPGSLVIGSDQTMSLDDRVFHKPATLDEAHSHLSSLSGQTHQLNSAVVLQRDGRTVWSHVSTARLSMRVLDGAFITRHLERVGAKALTSVGAYQLEGEGVQLFEAIEGDFFTILGLPLLPLLAELRRQGAIDA